MRLRLGRAGLSRSDSPDLVAVTFHLSGGCHLSPLRGMKWAFIKVKAKGGPKSEVHAFEEMLGVGVDFTGLAFHARGRRRDNDTDLCIKVSPNADARFSMAVSKSHPNPDTRM